MHRRPYILLIILSATLIIAPLTAFLLGGRTMASEAKAAAPRISVVSTKVTPSPISTLDVLTIGTTLKNNAQRVDDLYVELKVRAEDGQEVLHAAQRGVGIDGGENQSVYWVWRIPGRLGSGDYTVQIGVYGPDRTTLYAMDETAGGFHVDAKTY